MKAQETEDAKLVALDDVNRLATRLAEARAQLAERNAELRTINDCLLGDAESSVPLFVRLRSRWAEMETDLAESRAHVARLVAALEAGAELFDTAMDEGTEYSTAREGDWKLQDPRCGRCQKSDQATRCGYHAVMEAVDASPTDTLASVRALREAAINWHTGQCTGIDQGLPWGECCRASVALAATAWAES